ncbi:hypothetical protein V8C42DRAFT_306101 [Trichoderma barbatum]
MFNGAQLNQVCQDDTPLARRQASPSFCTAPPVSSSQPAGQSSTSQSAGHSTTSQSTASQSAGHSTTSQSTASQSAGHSTTSQPSSTSPSSPPVCTYAPPAVKDDYTVTLKLFSDAGCCNAFDKTVSKGVLKSCVTPGQSFGGFAMAVGQNPLSQGWKVQMFSEGGCAGISETYDLSNGPTCYHDQTWASFQLISEDSLPPPPPPTCNITQPAVKDDYTVSLDLWSTTDCCSQSVLATHIGATNQCKSAVGPFQGISLSAGKALLGGTKSIRVFADSSCSSSSYLNIDLNNAPQCFGDGRAFLSYIFFDPATAPPPPPACTASPPAIKDDYTVSLDLWSALDCCSKLVQSTHIGAVNSCKAATGSFQGVSISAGQALLGQGKTVRLFEGTGCSSSHYDIPLDNFININQPACFGGGGTFTSYEIYDSSTAPPPPPPPPTGSCDGPPGSPKLGSEASVQLYTDSDCCHTGGGAIVWGGLDGDTTYSCYTPGYSFALKEAVGQAVFGHGVHIIAYSDSNCQNQAATIAMTNAGTCFNQGGLYKSYRIGTFSAAPPPPPPSSSEASIQLYTDSDCCHIGGGAIVWGGLDGDTTYSCYTPGYSFALKEAAVFGHGVHIIAYSDSNCQNQAATISMTNAGTCFNQGGLYKSYRIGTFTSSSPPSTPPQHCSGRPSIPDANSVTVRLHGDQECCQQSGGDLAFTNIASGWTSDCVTPGFPFYGITQAVGQNAFSKGIHIKAYVDTHCNYQGGGDISMTNANSCFPYGDPWYSYRIGTFKSSPPPPPPPPPSGPSYHWNIGVATDYTGAVGYSKVVAWVDGQDVCADSVELAVGGNNPCGTFYFAGIYSWALAGCGGPNLWMNYNGVISQNCYKVSNNWGECNGGWIIVRTYACY